MPGRTLIQAQAIGDSGVKNSQQNETHGSDRNDAYGQVMGKLIQPL